MRHPSSASRRSSRPSRHGGPWGIALREARGATLIEFVLLGGIYAFVVNGALAAAKTNDFLRAQAQIRAALDNIVDESRWAQNITAAGATSVTLSVPQNTPFSASSPYSVTFAYNAAQQVITRQQDAGPAVALAYLVTGPGGSSGLTFTYFD